MTINKNHIKKIFINLFWLLTGVACITLLVSAVHNKEEKRCKGLFINITGANNNLFIDKHDVYNIIKNFGGDTSLKRSLASIDLGKIEKLLENDVWIKNAELYFDNNNILKVSVEEREPVARVFTATGNTFYIDSSCKMLPLSDKFSARLPVFTGFTTDAKILLKADSNLLCDIKNISIKIAADSFLMAMIDQVDIDANRNFEMTPKMGKQNILFGDGTDTDAKFAKLKLFYKDVITKAGWNRYNTIDLRYKGQVVAKIRGKEDIVADSLQTLQLMKFIAADAARRSADSLQTFVQDNQNNTADSSLINQSMQRDESEGAAMPVNENLKVPAVVVPQTTGATTITSAPKPIETKPAPAVTNKITTANKLPAVTNKISPKPATVKVSKPAQPAAEKPKPKTTAAQKPVVKKPVVQQKPKVTMPKKTNEY
jgi:cell division protein FtsQ